MPRHHHRWTWAIMNVKNAPFPMQINMGKCKCETYRFLPIENGQKCPKCGNIMLIKRDYFMFLKDRDYPVCQRCAATIVADELERILKEEE